MNATTSELLEAFLHNSQQWWTAPLLSKHDFLLLFPCHFTTASFAGAELQNCCEPS